MVRRRQYMMVARAQAAERTGERILDAAVEVFFDEPAASISLDEVARRAAVTVQTVIRRFGGRDGLLAAAAERESEKVRQEREVPEGDVDGALRVLVEHYERTGDRVLRMLAEEPRGLIGRSRSARIKLTLQRVKLLGARALSTAVSIFWKHRRPIRALRVVAKVD